MQGDILVNRDLLQLLGANEKSASRGEKPVQVLNVVVLELRRILPTHKKKSSAAPPTKTV